MQYYKIPVFTFNELPKNLQEGILEKLSNNFVEIANKVVDDYIKKALKGVKRYEWTYDFRLRITLQSSNKRKVNISRLEKNAEKLYNSFLTRENLLKEIEDSGYMFFNNGKQFSEDLTLSGSNFFDFLNKE